MSASSTGRREGLRRLEPPPPHVGGRARGLGRRRRHVSVTIRAPGGREPDLSPPWRRRIAMERVEGSRDPALAPSGNARGAQGKNYGRACWDFPTLVTPRSPREPSSRTIRVALVGKRDTSGTSPPPETFENASHPPSGGGARSWNLRVQRYHARALAEREDPGTYTTRGTASRAAKDIAIRVYVGGPATRKRDAGDRHWGLAHSYRRAPQDLRGLPPRSPSLLSFLATAESVAPRRTDNPWSFSPLREVRRRTVAHPSPLVPAGSKGADPKR